MWENHITQQPYDNATNIPCDSIPRNIIELDPNSQHDDFHIIKIEPDLVC